MPKHYSKRRKSAKKKKTNINKDGNAWISHKIELLMKEGRPQNQAIAIAHAMARRKGFKVPMVKKGRKKNQIIKK